ncbi:hypothetical protein [Hyphobacterium sp.]|uniref:hypothetical protein n=1 Tax=Hyphobacterium sp. TaxID=2004662 RepID=UPI003BABC8EA
MRYTLLIFTLVLTACSPREDRTEIRLTQADLHEFIVLSALLETGDSETALARFATLEIGENNVALERLAMRPERETITLFETEPPEDGAIVPELRLYDGFLDYTLFELGGAALAGGDLVSLESIIALLQLRRDVTRTVVIFNNCQRALFADILIELRDEALTSEEIFDRWQSGTARNAACDHAGSGGQLVFWPLFDSNYAPIIEAQIAERLQQSGMEVHSYWDREPCLYLLTIEELGDVLEDPEFAGDASLDDLRDQVARCSRGDRAAFARAQINPQSGPSLPQLVAQDLLPSDLAAFLLEAGINEDVALCEQTLIQEDGWSCTEQVQRLVHEPVTDRWVIYIHLPFGTHFFTVARQADGYEILSAYFLGVL